MKVAVLCDGDRKIGAGHFFRCLAIARELHKQSVETLFFIPCKDLQSFIVKSGVDYKLLHNLFSDSESMIREVLSNLDAFACDVVLIDSHRATERLLTEINRRYKAVYIDDSLDFPYPVDVLINTHIDVTEEDYLALYEKSGIAIPTLLIGAAFFPLNKPVSGVWSQTNDRNVGFFAGGADPDHVTVRMLKYLFEHRIIIKYTFHIAVGMMNTDYDEIINYCKRSKMLRVHYGLSDLTEIYKQIDLAVSAAGITLYELAAFGIPTVSYSMVDNQLHTSEAFDRLGISVNVGDSRHAPVFERMFFNIDELLQDEKELKAMSERAKNVIDGRGALRIAECLIKKE